MMKPPRSWQFDDYCGALGPLLLVGWGWMTWRYWA